MQTTRPYHPYMVKPEGKNAVVLDGHHFVSYDPKYLDVRGGGKISKAQRILNHIRKHKDQAFFSRDVFEALKDQGVKIRDVSS